MRGEKMKKAMMALSTLVFMCAALAQAALPLTIECNESGAEVYVNGRPMAKTMPNVVLSLPSGVYSIRIVKEGFQEYLNNDVAVRGARGALLRALLQPAPIAAPREVPAAVPDSMRSANAFTPAPASERGFVQAPAESSFQAPAPMSNSAPAPAAVMDKSERGPRSAPAFASEQDMAKRPKMVVATFPLNVDSNIIGAQVYINGALSGQTPFIAYLPMGSYSVSVRAPGYFDDQRPISVNGPLSINAVLRSAMASWQMIVPEAFARNASRDKSAQFQKTDVELWVDGLPARAFAGQLTPGRHVLRLTSGGLAVETPVDIQAGRAYVFEPFLGINVK
jgi:hypothetical protein